MCGKQKFHKRCKFFVNTVTCEIPAESENMTRLSPPLPATYLLVGVSFVAACSPGFVQTDGDASRRCLATGNLDGQELVCRRGEHWACPTNFYKGGVGSVSPLVELNNVVQHTFSHNMFSQHVCFNMFYDVFIMKFHVTPLKHARVVCGCRLLKTFSKGLHPEK